MKYWLVFLIPCLFSTLGFTQTLYFPPTNSLNWDTAAPQQLGWCTERVDSLYRFLDANNTKAFIVLQDGKIVLERYFGGHTQFSPWQWASAGKTLTALLVGIAQEEGLLSIHDTTATYLGNAWTDCSITEEEQ
ncbi:MAG: beta-lactamase family protein, partial [Schleiferiaceae bacterium]|nr:beta-lactamase family protein [Schleiferiaceae bacterium]